jgi:hypothetical protein
MATNNHITGDRKSNNETVKPEAFKANPNNKKKRAVIDVDATPVTSKVRPRIDHDGLANEGTNVSYEERR